MWNCFFAMDNMYTVQGWIQQGSGGLDTHPLSTYNFFKVYVENGKKKDILI
jgi:hypothetical protein